MEVKKNQDQFTVYERNGQLVLAINSEMMIPENAPVRLLNAQLEELEYEKLYEAYSSKGRKSAADPRVLFNWYMGICAGSTPAGNWRRPASTGSISNGCWRTGKRRTTAPLPGSVPGVAGM